MKKLLIIFALLFSISSVFAAPAHGHHGGGHHHHSGGHHMHHRHHEKNPAQGPRH